MPHIIVGTAGHIDHGKTTLVKALTGIDADRLKEEKERGITIDIGFASLALDNDTQIGFVDVPGHERFIKNMLAGVGGIDLVMLVIAANESVMPQTREHLDICSLLHIKQGFTVLTKVDTVEIEMADLVEEEVREFLKGSFLANSPILRVSASTGKGLAELVDTLRRYAHQTEPKDATRIFRLPVDRSFTMKGFGTVVTGTLISGRIRRDDEVDILPLQRVTRVRGIQVHGQPAVEALAGQRTALNLQGLEVSDVERGMVLTIPGVFSPTSMLDCHLELLDSAPHAIEHRKRIRLHIGTAELIGYVVLLGQERLEPGQSAFVQIRTEQPTFALPGDRFIIRQYSPMITIGGGQILESSPRKHRPSEKDVTERLHILQTGSVHEVLYLRIREAGLAGLDLPSLVAGTGLTSEVVRQNLLALAKDNKVRVMSENPLTIVGSEVFNDALHRVLVHVQRFHQANPLVLGISREELKNRALGDVPGAVFQTILDKLLAEKKIAVGQDVVHEYGRKVTLKQDEEQIRNSIADRFRSLGLQVPPPDELIAALKLDAGVAKKIVQLLLKENVLVKINDDILLHRSTVDKLIGDVKNLKARNPKLGVGEFKDLTGVSRKYAIPLLEYLDRQRVTRRVGEDRMIL
jgi:selenocysteine-specific elongation factor